MFGIDDLDLGSLADILGVGADLAGGVTGAVDAGAWAAPAAVDTANGAFMGGAPALDVGGSNVLDEGSKAAAVGQQFPGETMGSTASPPSTDPNAVIAQPGVGSSGTSGNNELEQGSMNSPPPTSMSALPPSPAQSFREAVSAVPGKWYDAFQNAPAQIANYAGEHPFKTGAALLGLGAQAYGMANQNSAPASNFAPPTSGPRPAVPALPKNGPPASPIISGGTGTKGRGGFRVGM